MARDFAAAPRGRVLRPRRRVDPGVRRSLPAGWSTSSTSSPGNLDRPGGADVHHARPSTSSAARTGRGPPRPLAAAASAACPSSAASCRWRRSPRRSTRRARARSAALVTVAGNPVLSTPNGRRLERALDGARLHGRRSTSTSTRRRATRTSSCRRPRPLEHDHYDLVFNALAVRNTAKYSPALFEPGPDARHDWEILDELTPAPRPTDRRDGPRAGAGLHARARAAPAARPRLCASAPTARGFKPVRRRARRSASCERHPHGIDLGPLEPRLPDRLRTADSRIELAPRLFVADLARLASRLAGDRRRPATRCCSSAAASCAATTRGCTTRPRLMGGRRALHAADASRRRDASGARRDGGRVRVSSRVGERRGRRSR